jgi:hypothetical protein
MKTRYFLSYDYETFDEAVAQTMTVTSEITHWIKYAEHDHALGICFQYQIYNQGGEVVYQSLRSSDENEAA